MGIKKFILRNWLTYLWRLAGLKWAMQSGSLETQKSWWCYSEHPEPEHSEEPVVQMKSKAVREFSLVGGREQFCVLCLPTPSWMRSVHIVRAICLTIKFTNLYMTIYSHLNHISIKNTFIPSEWLSMHLCIYFIQCQVTIALISLCFPFSIALLVCK